MTDVQTPGFSASQLAALVECMLSTARVDGLHPQEEALIRKFYDEQRQPGMPAYEAVAAAGGQPLKALSGDAAFAEQLVLMCLMAGYADGRLTDAERNHVAGLATQLALSPARLGELHVQVKDSLIGSLAHLPEPESVAALAKTL
jgi:tellurite resistance protein